MKNVIIEFFPWNYNEMTDKCVSRGRHFAVDVANSFSSKKIQNSFDTRLEIHGAFCGFI